MQTTGSPLERYVARLKDERSVLDRLLHQLEADGPLSGKQIQSTLHWVEQVRLRLAEIDAFLKAVEKHGFNA
jgi:hypothetical protein